MWSECSLLDTVLTGDLFFFSLSPGDLSQTIPFFSGAAVALITILENDFYKICLFHWGVAGKKIKVKRERQKEKYRKMCILSYKILSYNSLS